MLGMLNDMLELSATEVEEANRRGGAPRDSYLGL